MMKWALRILGVALLAGAGYWAWLTFFPGPEQVIQKRLQSLARATSFPRNEAALPRLANAQAMANFFTTDVEVTVDIPGRSQQTFSGREEVLQAAVAARSSVNGLNVDFFDIIITVAPDRQSAVANLTARARIPTEKDFYVQELKLGLRKVGGDWLIFRVETVKTLSHRPGPAASRNTV
jgi:hypothetical protein